MAVRQGVGEGSVERTQQSPKSHGFERRGKRAVRGAADAIVDAIRAPLVVLDPRRRVVSANKAFYRTFDSDPDAMVGRPLSATAARPLDTPSLRAMVDRVAGTRETVDGCELTVGLPDGGARTFAATASRVEGQAANVLVALQDVGDIRGTERTLIEAEEALDRADLAKSRFLVAASHDLRQPLQTLSLLHGTLRQRLADKEALAALTAAERTCESMKSIVRMMLDLDQLERGAIRANVSEFPPYEIFDRLDDEFAALAAAKGLDWRRVDCGRFIRSDRALLENMIRNLLSNAVRYTDRGRILLGCRRRGERLRIEVWDTGIGIAATRMPRIFEQYQGATDAAERGGLGLGLAIVQSFAALLGHAIDVRSRVGKGSVFAIEVPLVARAGARRAVRTAARHRACAGLSANVLVIESDPALRASIETLLSAHGHHVATAANSAGARAALAGDPRPDLVISNYDLMSDMNGVQNVAMVRAILGPLPAIILTADLREETMRDIARNGCIALAKPTNPHELSGLVQQLLNGPVPAAPPVAAPPIAPGAKTAPLPHSIEHDGRPTIAIVDDDRDMRAAIQLLLGRAGYRVRNFADAQAFLDGHRAGDAGCLIADVRMPGMSGLEMLARLAAVGDMVPTIIISGQADIGMAVEAMRAGAVDFIEKPVVPEVLLAAADRAVRRAASPAEHSAARAAAAMRLAALTRRERDVMALIVAGLANKEVAGRLGINRRTVEAHRATIMKKMGARSLSDLVRFEIAARAAG